MAQKTIATLLILSAFAIAGANSASAEDGGFHGRDGGGFHGRGHHGTRPPVTVGGFVGLDGYAGGYGDGGGYGNQGAPGGYGDWYGISSGHDGCTLFRQRVMTPEGWRIQMVPVC
jgi:hypothetical protein